jgi:hypothetical protein
MGPQHTNIPRNTHNSTVSEAPKDQTPSVDLKEKLNFTHSPGRHSALSPVVGARTEEEAQLRSALKDHPNLAHLEEALYNPEFINLIPKEQKEQADKLGMDRFVDYIKKYEKAGVTSENAIDWSDIDFRLGATYTYDIENESNTWNVHAVVEKDGTVDSKKYVPSGIVARHEIMHVEQTEPRISEARRKSQALKELVPSLDTIIELDAVYKELNKIPLNDLVTHQKGINWANKEIDLGEVANFYRGLASEHGSIAKALISKESLEFIDSHKFQPKTEKKQLSISDFLENNLQDLNELSMPSKK